MIIRQANKFDLNYFIHLVHKNLDDGMIGYYNIELNDTYLNSLFNTIIHGGGIAYVVESDGPIGMIVGIISPNIWSPEVLIMHQILLFVDEEYRNTKAGHLLIKEYIDRCNELRTEKRIKYHTISATKQMFEMDFTRFGYDWIEKTWMSSEVE